MGSHYHQESLEYFFCRVKLPKFFKQYFVLDISDHSGNLFLSQN